MCGIAGIYASSGHEAMVLQSGVEAMTLSLGHHGPDGQGRRASSDGRLHPGHTRLAIIDLSAARAQPMESAHGHCTIGGRSLYCNLTRARGCGQSEP